jgi:hypothetical protein
MTKMSAARAIVLFLFTKNNKEFDGKALSSDHGTEPGLKEELNFKVINK